MENQQSDIKLSGLLFEESDYVLLERTEYLKEYLSYVMKDLRTQANLSQAELAEVLGVKQPAVAKLEKADRQHDIESVMRYLHAVGGELTVGVKYKDRFYQVTEPSKTVIVDVPEPICRESLSCRMDVRSYVHEALGDYQLQGQAIIDNFFQVDYVDEEPEVIAS